MLKKVTKAQSRNNATGTDVWDLVLECGHARTEKKKSQTPPTRRKCPACAAQARLEARA